MQLLANLFFWLSSDSQKRIDNKFMLVYKNAVCAYLTFFKITDTEEQCFLHYLCIYSFEVDKAFKVSQLII